MSALTTHCQSAINHDAQHGNAATQVAQTAAALSTAQIDYANALAAQPPNQQLIAQTAAALAAAEANYANALSAFQAAKDALAIDKANIAADFTALGI